MYFTNIIEVLNTNWKTDIHTKFFILPNKLKTLKTILTTKFKIYTIVIDDFWGRHNLFFISYNTYANCRVYLL